MGMQYLYQSVRLGEYGGRVYKIALDPRYSQVSDSNSGGVFEPGKCVEITPHNSKYYKAYTKGPSIFD